MKTTAEPTKRTYISREIKRQLLKQAQYQCTYVSVINQRRCEAKSALQIEHLQPFAKGGSSERGNLTVLCAQHNRLRAIAEFGASKMQSYFTSG